VIFGIGVEAGFCALRGDVSAYIAVTSGGMAEQRMIDLLSVNTPFDSVRHTGTTGTATTVLTEAEFTFVIIDRGERHRMSLIDLDA
jgi:hypothetical protein